MDGFTEGRKGEGNDKKVMKLRREIYFLDNPASSQWKMLTDKNKLIGFRNLKTSNPEHFSTSMIS